MKIPPPPDLTNVCVHSVSKCSEMKSLKAQQGGYFSTGPAHTCWEETLITFFDCWCQLNNKQGLHCKGETVSMFFHKDDISAAKQYIKYKSCIETENAYLVGSVYLWGSPSSILHIVFFHLGTNFWTGSNVACRLVRKGEAAKKGRVSCQSGAEKS